MPVARSLLEDFDDRALRVVAALCDYFAERTELGGAILFTCAEADEFNLALVEAVPTHEADATLAAIVGHYRERQATPRMRLPLPVPAELTAALARAGFVAEPERTVVLARPVGTPIAVDPDIAVTRVVTPAELDRVSAIQVAAFGIPLALHAWDRQVARSHLARGRYRFSLASLDGVAVGAAAACSIANATGVHALATHPAAQRRGVATALLGHLAADARKRGDERLVLATADGGYAVGFYSRLGFNQVQTLQGFACRH